jgi:hypothetical protein
MLNSWVLWLEKFNSDFNLMKKIKRKNSLIPTVQIIIFHKRSLKFFNE